MCLMFAIDVSKVLKIFFLYELEVKYGAVDGKLKFNTT